MDKNSDALAVPGELESISRVRSWLEQLLLKWSVPRETVSDIQTAISELCTNVVRHGYKGGGAGEIRLEMVLNSGTVEITVSDDAPHFKPDPRVQLPRQRLAEGGYGLYLIHSLMDQVTYESAGEAGNRTVLIKRVSESPAQPESPNSSTK